MKRIFVLTILGIFCFSLALKAEELTLSLEEAVAIALRDNWDILLKIQDVQKAKAKIAEAKADLYPTLDFIGTWSDTRGLYAKDVTQAATQTTLKQYLYKGGKIINAIKYNGYNFEVSEALLDKVRQDTVLSVKKAFYTLVLADEFARLNKQTEQHLDSEKKRYEKGQISESAILKIESSLASVKKAYEESLNQVGSSQALLNNLLHLESDLQPRPDAKLDYKIKDISFDRGLLQALRQRPEIRQYEAQGKADQKAIEAAKADVRPQIYASWDYYSRSISSLSFSPNRGWQDYNIIGFNFSWPIFDGWAARAKVDEAIADLKASQLNKDKAIRDITLEVKNAYIALKNFLLQQEANESEIKIYADSLESFKKKYAAGLASGLDLDDAKIKYEISLFNRKQAVYDCLIARSNLENAIGR
jgi:outer membrane protein